VESVFHNVRWSGVLDMISEVCGFSSTPFGCCCLVGWFVGMMASCFADCCLKEFCNSSIPLVHISSQESQRSCGDMGEEVS